MLFNLEIETNNSKKALGLMIRFYRLQQGYTLRDLGEIAMMSHTLIANIEQGKINGSSETLRDIFKALDLDFYDVDDQIDEFKEIYDKTFNYLFIYDYTRATKEIERLLEKESLYRRSILISDYFFLKFLYKVLLGESPRDDFVNLSLVETLSVNFNDRQKQLYYLIDGIDHYNMGLYHEGANRLESALKIGVSALDNLTKVFLVKCYVKMYRFMDMIKISNEIIDFFENNVMYLRAMEVRLSIVYSYLLVRKFKDAEILLDSVYEFSSNFNAIYLLDECYLLRATLLIYSKKYEEAVVELRKVKRPSAIIYFMKMRIYSYQGKPDEVTRIYNTYLNTVDLDLNEKSNLILDLTAYKTGILELNDDEFIDKCNEVLEIAFEACDIEVIDNIHNYLISYYTEHRMYKKAFEASELAREYRKYGCSRGKLL